jgi:tetratricopeptide (TPR) repeat protein
VEAAPRRPVRVPATRSTRLLSSRLLALTAALLAACQSGPETKIDPEKQFEVYKQTSAYHYADGQYDRAEAQALKALELHPDDTKMRYMVAWCRLRREKRGDLLAAEAQFRELYEEDPLYEAQLGLANTLDRLGKLRQEAAEAIRSGQREAGGGAEPGRRVDELEAEARDDWNEAYALYEHILEARPDDRSALNGMQRVAGLLGNYEASVSASERLLAALESERTFWNQQLQRDDLSDGEEQRLRSRANETRDLEVATRFFASSALRRLGRTADAVRQLDAIAALDPELPEVYSRRADLLHALGRNPEAILDIDRYLKRSPHPYEHPDIKRAYELRTRCEAALRDARATASASSG